MSVLKHAPDLIRTKELIEVSFLMEALPIHDQRIGSQALKMPSECRFVDGNKGVHAMIPKAIFVAGATK